MALILEAKKTATAENTINTMNDTPLTAKAKIACGFQAVPQSFLEHAENLERENDTLRKAHHKYESTLHDLRSVLDVTPLESFVQAVQRLERENAALLARAEKAEADRDRYSATLAVASRWLLRQRDGEGTARTVGKADCRERRAAGGAKNGQALCAASSGDQ